MGLWYPKDSGFKLIAYSDADHAGCKDECKSTSGGLQFLGEKLMSWSSKKQDCTAMSTAEAKYVSLSACCAQVIWMRTQLLDYGYKYNRIPMYCDSKSEHVEKGTVELYFVGTEYQLADLFTKALPKERFEYLVHRIVIIMAQQQHAADVHLDELCPSKKDMILWMLTRILILNTCNVHLKANLSSRIIHYDSALQLLHQAKFLSRKSFDTLVDHLQEVMVESIPTMVAKELLLERQHNKEQTDKMIGNKYMKKDITNTKWTKSEHENGKRTKNPRPKAKPSFMDQPGPT
ncbi:hypothetical protein Tco_0163906 [Tanacetum coccineum]